MYSSIYFCVLCMVSHGLASLRIAASANCHHSISPPLIIQHHLYLSPTRTRRIMSADNKIYMSKGHILDRYESPISSGPILSAKTRKSPRTGS